MKNTILILLITIACSCNKTATVENTDCTGCNCPLGKEGSNCEISSSDKFVGTYIVKDTGFVSYKLNGTSYVAKLINSTHTSIITKSGNFVNDRGLMISNYFGNGISVEALVGGSDNKLSNNQFEFMNGPYVINGSDTVVICYDNPHRPKTDYNSVSFTIEHNFTCYNGPDVKKSWFKSTFIKQ